MLRSTFLKLILALALLPLLAPAAADARGPRKPLPDLEDTARAYLLVDSTSGEVLKAHNAQEALVPASLTKVMTLRLVFSALARGELSRDENVSVSKRAWGARAPIRGTSMMFLQPGKPVTVDQLIEGIAVASANDAAVALAERIAGSHEKFVAMMNAEALRLGLPTAKFHDAHGLSPKNRISAADMARLAMSVLRDYPQYLDYASREWMSYNNIRQRNTMRLLGRLEGVDGLKTGYLSTTGYNVVVTAKRGDRRLVAVVLGTPRRVAGRRGGRVRDMLAAELLTAGFETTVAHHEPL